MVMPFGKATDALVFGPGGNPVQCVAVKTFYLAGGTLSFNETVDPNGFSCTDRGSGQACGLFNGHVSDVLASGTGAFAGATGSLVGTFSIANLGNPVRSARVESIATLVLP